jgi:hypothetical protein
MGKGILISGIVLGVIGLVWSFLLMVLLIAILAIFGGSPGSAIWIPGIGMPFGIMAIIGGVVGSKREKAGATVLLLSGLLSIVGALSIYVFLTGVRLTTEDAIILVLVMYWWAILLIIVGGVFLALEGRAERVKEAEA